MLKYKYGISFAYKYRYVIDKVINFKTEHLNVIFQNGLYFLVSDHVLTIDDISYFSKNIGYDIIIDCNNDLLYVYCDYIE